jgi:hypothetical protein
MVASLNEKKSCRQDRDLTESFRIIQLGTLDHPDEMKKCIVGQGQQSMSFHHSVLNHVGRIENKL